MEHKPFPNDGGLGFILFLGALILSLAILDGCKPQTEFKPIIEHSEIPAELVYLLIKAPDGVMDTVYFPAPIKCECDER